MAEETKISQAQIVKPVIKIKDNTNKLLSLWGRPVERVRKNNQALTQGQRPQTARARDDKGRFVAVAKPQERVKVNPLKSVFEPTINYDAPKQPESQSQTKSAKNLEIARQKKVTRRQEGFFSKLLKKAGFFGKETVGAVGDVTDKTFFEKLAGPIYGTAKELQEAGKEVWDSTKSIGERIGKAFGKKGGLAGIIGTLTGGLGVGGLLTAGAGGLLTGAAGAIPAIVSAVLVALAGAAGYGIGKIVNGLIDKAMGEKGAIGSKLYDVLHPEQTGPTKAPEKLPVGPLGVGKLWHKAVGAVANFMYGDKEVGAVSERYESNGDPGAINPNDRGGPSYGAYQISSNREKGGISTLDQYLEQSKFGEEFAGLQPGTTEFGEKWKSLGSSRKEDFYKDQKAFIAKSHYQPALKSLKNAGMDMSERGRAIQEAIWSTSVQYGSASPIIRALSGKDLSGMTDSDIIKSINDYKIATVNDYFKPEHREGVAKRALREGSDLLDIANDETANRRGTVTASNKGAALITAPEAIKPQTIESPQSVTVAAQKATQDQIAKMTSSLGDVTKNIDPKKWVNDKMDKDMGFDVNMVPSELDDVTLTLMRYDRL